MSERLLFFLGGNGHCAARLAPARAAFATLEAPYALLELPYPQTESFDELLVEVADSADALDRTAPVYATGIGALVALALRGRGRWQERRLILQGAVLWGLERRWFPRVMRVPPMPHLLAWAFRLRFVQKHFVAKHFRRSLDASERHAFFAGYGTGERFAAWFRWLTPALLRRLEIELSEPRALDGVEFWYGEQDTVVGIEELRVTERVLERALPFRKFESWGHYPMIDDPMSWTREVLHALAAARTTS